MSQAQRIMDYINAYGSISPLEAFRDLGITKLATRISEMTREGMAFEKKYCETKNRFGETVRYMRYSLKG